MHIHNLTKTLNKELLNVNLVHDFEYLFDFT